MGTKLDSLGNLGITNLIRNYISDLSEVLFHPTRFYRGLNLAKPVAGSLVFATVTHWIGAAVAHLWEGLYRNLFSEATTFIKHSFTLAEDVMEISKNSAMSPELAKGRELLRQFQTQWYPLWSEWASHVEKVLLDPFFTLFKISIYSFFVFLGARLLLKSKHYTYRSLVNLICYSYAPSLFLILPLMGGVIGKLYSLVLLTIGISELAREPEPIGVLRAATVAAFPYILLYSFALLIIAIMLVGVLTLVGTLLFQFL